jgi:hypothetical protein
MNANGREVLNTKYADTTGECLTIKKKYTI